MRIKPTAFICAFLLFSMASCKKSDTSPSPPPSLASRADMTRDSIFYYAKQIYLWNDALPSYEVFNPRKYTFSTTDLDNYNSELFAITQLKINPLTGLPYEYYSGTRPKYSYIEDIANKNPSAYVPETKSAVDLEGNGNDLGLKLGAYGSNSNYSLFVTAVYQNSPADKAGMIRSDKISKINGVAIGVNFDGEKNMINAAFDAATIQLEGVKYVNGNPGSAFNITLNKAVYKSSPIYSVKVLTAGTKKIGYLAYARFSVMTNSKSYFDEAFNTFNTAGVTDLVIDLRYNGGGYVNTAQYLTNLIVPASKNGLVMFSEHYNATMQNGQAKILANQPLLDDNNKIQYQNGKMLTYADVNYSVASNTEKIEKAGPLQNISNVVFIVSGNTASASELVINSLKPHMNVKLVGTKSYGKPIGFFPVTIENKYDVYFSLFQSKNSKGEGDYFDGFTPDVIDTFDDPYHNFGDQDENYLVKAINLLAPGSPIVLAKANTTMSLQGQKNKVNVLPSLGPVVDGHEFIGMIETKHKVK